MAQKDVQYTEVENATIATAEDLHTIAASLAEEHISELTLPEVEEVVNVIARVIPAGNVPGLIASGLARLEGSNPSEKDVKRDVGMLFRGVNQMLDKAVYNVFFAGPAQILWGYQNILKLTGKDPDAAFPEGTWQFYVDYALREDTARHSNETNGFDRALHDKGVVLDDIDRMTCWMMTVVETLHEYPKLLENEWRERVYIRELINLVDDEKHRKRFADLHSQWLKVLPYRRMADARGDEDYPAYRRRKFDEWLFQFLAKLSKAQRLEWLKRHQTAKENELQAYVRQMSIRSYLHPDQYAETRTPVEISNMHVAIVYGEHYYLIPICEEDTQKPIDASTVRSAIMAIVQQPSQEAPAELALFARIKRGQWEALQRKLPKTLLDELHTLRLCPIVLNFNPRNRNQPLAEIRQAERGIGDHALTIFDTRESFVFDQSHIYFDGAWGVALAEIMTNKALKWASDLSLQDRVIPTERPYSPRFHLSSDIRKTIEKLDRVMPEVSAENAEIHIEGVLELRDIFKQRNDLLSLTVNDMLLLYRAIHAIRYRPDKKLVDNLKKLRKERFAREAADSALEAMKAQAQPPAILMPVDAGRSSPRDRLHPMSFEVPLQELNLVQLHHKVVNALDDYEQGGTSATFDRLQRHYLAALAGFGQVMQRAKEIANAGESASVGTIKLLAHVPVPLQHLLNQIPGRFETLNDIIKGREVFSNVGRVAESSTLTRFISAKDDNSQKELVWGVLTTAQGYMDISLRDFRPHVGMLIKIGHRDLAQTITEDYLDTFVREFEQYIQDLHRITLKSRETRLSK